VAGSEALIDYLIQFSRPYIYTTALPPAVAAACRESLRLVVEEPWRRERLAALIARFRAGARTLGLPLMDSPTPIQPLLIGDDARVMAVAANLLGQGIHVGAIRYPTVPRGSARLRITLNANHDEGQIDCLLAALTSALASPWRGAGWPPLTPSAGRPWPFTPGPPRGPTPSPARWCCSTVGGATAGPGTSWCRCCGRGSR